MSNNFGGAGETADRASRNMVLQNGQAAATVPAPVAASSRARLWLTRSPCLFAQERQAAAGSATEAAFAGARRIDHFAGSRKHGRAARHRRCDSGPDSRDRDRRCLRRCDCGSRSMMASHKFAVMLDGRGLAVFLPIGRDGAHAMRADGNDLGRPCSASAFRDSIRRAAGTPDRCPAGGPDRRCTSLFAERRRSFPDASSRARRRR